MEISHIIGYAGAVLIGLVLGLLGGGGGLIAIPVLVYLFHIDTKVATGYSLFLVAISASSGALQNIRKKKVDYTAALYYGVPSVITVYLVRRFVLHNLPDPIFTIGHFSVSDKHFILFILALVMFGAAYKMITDDDEKRTEKVLHKNHRIILMMYAVLIGSFLGLVGAGGGFLIVPALIYFANVPTKRAVGTGLVLVSSNAIIGFLGDIGSHEYMDWPFLLTFSAFSVAGVFIGHYLSNFIEAHKLKKAFGWFILVVGIYIVVKETLLK